MKKVIALFGLLLLMNTYSLKAQLPTCDKIYMDRVDLFFGLPINNSLYVYDPALPDINGRVIYSEKADDAMRHDLNTENLPRGLYSIKIISDKGIIVRKLQLL